MKSLRAFVRSVLLEGAVEAGKTTAVWWKEQGKEYKGKFADSPYYLYKDDKTGEVSTNGGPMRRDGDPYTFFQIDNNSVRVMSGPRKESIGAILKIKGGDDDVGGEGAPEAAGGAGVKDTRESPDINKNIRLAMTRLLLAITYLARSLTYLHEACGFYANQGPDTWETGAKAGRSYAFNSGSFYTKCLKFIRNLKLGSISIESFDIITPDNILQKSQPGSKMFEDSLQAARELSNFKSALKPFKSISFKWDSLEEATHKKIDNTLDDLNTFKEFFGIMSLLETVETGIDKNGNQQLVKVMMTFGNGLQLPVTLRKGFTEVIDNLKNNLKNLE